MGDKKTKDGNFNSFSFNPYLATHLYKDLLTKITDKSIHTTLYQQYLLLDINYNTRQH